MLEILVVVCSIFVWVMYHKLFNVVYFDFSRGCLQEIIISVIFGSLLAIAVMKFWFIAIPIVIFAVYKMIKK